MKTNCMKLVGLTLFSIFFLGVLALASRGSLAGSEESFCGKTAHEINEFAANSFNISKELEDLKLQLTASDFGALVGTLGQNETTAVGLKVNQATGIAYAVTATLRCDSKKSLQTVAFAVVPRSIR